MAAAKDKITLYVSAKLIRDIKMYAHVRSVSMSQLGEELLEDGIKRKIQDAELDVILPDLKKMFRTELAEAVKRITRLQVRGALDAGTIRALLINYMIRTGMEQETVLMLGDRAYEGAVRDLKEPLGDLQAIIDVADERS